MNREPADIESMVRIWKRILPSEVTNWVLFEHGTVVLCHETEMGPAQYAVSIIKAWGPVRPGTNLGDFSVRETDSIQGWIVEYAHEHLANYVSPDEVDTEPSAALVGLIGREKRAADSRSRNIMHVDIADFP
jgi:hypothetical protein